MAQSFTAGLSGSLDRVGLYLGVIDPTVAESLTVELRDVENGVPGALASENVAGTSVPSTATPGFVSISFTSPASVQAGTQYAIAAYHSSGPEALDYFWWHSGSDDYAGGQAFSSAAPGWAPFDFDMAFRTSVTLPSADLSVTNQGAPDPVISGQRLTYTVAATNNGPQDASAVTVSDPLPATGHFDSVSTTQGTCVRSAGTSPKTKNGTVTCSLGSLTSGASATITIVVTPTTPGTLTDTATVSSDQSDPDLTNNSATATTTVQGT